MYRALLSGKGSPLRTSYRRTSRGHAGVFRNLLSRGIRDAVMVGELSKLCHPLIPDSPQPMLILISADAILAGIVADVVCTQNLTASHFPVVISNEVRDLGFPLVSSKPGFLAGLGMTESSPLSKLPGGWSARLPSILQQPTTNHGSNNEGRVSRKDIPDPGLRLTSSRELVFEA